jgi:hypothetical protein
MAGQGGTQLSPIERLIGHRYSHGKENSLKFAINWSNSHLTQYSRNTTENAY